MTYKFRFYSDEVEGTIEEMLSGEEPELIKAAVRNHVDKLEDDSDLKKIRQRILESIADFELGNIDNLGEILDQYGGDGVSDLDAMIDYLNDQVLWIYFPTVIVEEVMKEG